MSEALSQGLVRKVVEWIKFKSRFLMGKQKKWPRPKRSRDTKALTVKLIGILLSMLALLATVYPLVEFDKITPGKSSLISIVGVVVLFLYVFLVSFEIYSAEGKRVFKQSDPDSIKNYMLHWIGYGGRVAVWTRDMSWAKDPDSQKLLIDKAKSNELIICLPCHTEFSRVLENEGASVYEYGTDLLADPSARFTIAYYGRDGSKVAIGRAKADQHIIEEFSSGAHPAFHLAYELVQIAKNASSRKNGN